jgi:hypothetical protein
MWNPYSAFITTLHIYINAELLITDMFYKTSSYIIICYARQVWLCLEYMRIVSTLYWELVSWTLRAPLFAASYQ